MAIQQLSTSSSTNVLALLFAGENFSLDGGQQFTAALESSLAQAGADVLTDSGIELGADAGELRNPATLLLADDADIELRAKQPGAGGMAGTVMPSATAGLDPKAVLGKQMRELPTADNEAFTAIPVISAEPEPPLATAEEAPLLLSDLLHEDAAHAPRLKERAKGSAFGQGIHHLINLVNEAAQYPGAAELAAAATPSVATEGKQLPLDGKTLPPLPQTAPVARSSGVAFSLTRNDGAPDMGFTGYGQQPQTADATAAVPQEFAAVTLPAAIDTPMPDNGAAFSAQAIQSSASHTIRDNAPLPPAAGDMPQLQSNELMGSEEWVQELGTKIEWLQDAKLQSAELQLHPAELGTLEIQIVAGEDGATISFITETAAARDAIESTLPRLRDMLASQGLQLDQSSVSQQSAESHKRGRGFADNGAGQQTPETPHADDMRALNHRVGRALEGGRINHYV